jgi:hypothetical protein
MSLAAESRAASPGGGECPVHPGRASVSACTRCGRFVCIACYDAAPAGLCPECGSLRAEPRRFGGWLILPMLGLIATPFILIARLVQVANQVREYGAENTLQYAPWVGHTLLMVVLASAPVAMSLFILPKFFAKRRRVPKLMVILYVTGALVQGLLLLWTALMLGREDALTEVRPFTRALTNGLIWSLYFRRSVRVKETFIR